MLEIESMQGLSPMPRRIEINGAIGVESKRLVVKCHDKELWTLRAADELAGFFQSRTGCKPRMDAKPGRVRPFHIHLLSGNGCGKYSAVFQAPFFSGAKGPVGFHSYRICSVGQDELVLQGLDRQGVYWGMKTLKQLISYNGRTVRIPMVRILDGADLEDRGIWTNTFTLDGASATRLVDAEKHYRNLIDWLSDHKINLIEVIALAGNGCSWVNKKDPRLSATDAKSTQVLMGRMMAYARSRGIRIVPTVSHTDHFALIRKLHPELKPGVSIWHHGHSLGLPINYYDDKAVRLMGDLAVGLCDAYSPDEICFWMAENRLHAISNSKESYFLKEAQVFHKIIDRVRHESKSDVGLKILLTQGSYPENPQIIRSFPKDTKWSFYSGERRGTYTTRKFNPIPPELSQAAAEGHWLSLCNTVVGGIARPAVLEVIRRNIAHAIDGRFRGINSMSFAYPADQMGLFVAAEYSWNSCGRGLDETLRSYALSQDVKDVRSQAMAYALYDLATLCQASLDKTGIGHPFGVFSRFYNMLERIKANDKVDELMMILADNMEEEELPALADAISDLEKALALADADGDELFRLRCRYLLHVMRISHNIAWAYYVNCREKSWDLCKGPWNNFREELRAAFKAIETEARASTPLYERIRKLEGWGRAWQNRENSNPLLKTADFARSIDAKKALSSRELQA